MSLFDILKYPISEDLNINELLSLPRGMTDLWQAKVERSDYPFHFGAYRDVYSIAFPILETISYNNQNKIVLRKLLIEAIAEYDVDS